MESTSPKKLKNKLKDYFKIAKKEAIKIKRKSGDKYILVSEEKFNELKSELASLQKRLLGVKEIAEVNKPKKEAKKSVVKTSKKVAKKTTKKIAKASEEKE
jgi:PHD/YefM family antitoxin component YafN of YafNO toxin-antitoxin module